MEKEREKDIRNAILKGWTYDYISEVLKTSKSTIKSIKDNMIVEGLIEKNVPKTKKLVQYRNGTEIETTPENLEKLARSEKNFSFDPLITYFDLRYLLEIWQEIYSKRLLKREKMEKMLEIILALNNHKKMVKRG